MSRYTPGYAPLGRAEALTDNSGGGGENEENKRLGTKEGRR